MNKLMKSAAFIAVTTLLTGCDDGSEWSRTFRETNPWDSGWTILIIAFITILLHALLTKGKEPNPIKAFVGFAIALAIVQITALTGTDLGWIALSTGLPAMSWMIYVEIKDRKGQSISTAKPTTGGRKLTDFLRSDTQPEKLEQNQLTGPICECGVINPKGYRFCGSCGKQPETQSRITSRPSRAKERMGF